MFDNLFTARGIRPGERGNIHQNWRNNAHLLPAQHLWIAGAAATMGLLGVAAAARANDQVQIEIRGMVAKECSISGGGRFQFVVDLGHLTESGSKKLEYSLNCNTPFRYQITSRYGAFRNHDNIKLTKRFDRVIPYKVSVVIPTDDVIINDSCESDTIKVGHVTCQLSDSRKGVAIDEQIQVVLSWIIQTPLVTGRYSDELTLKVIAKI
jgi:hypothetical protein